MSFPTLKQLSGAGRTLGLKGGKAAVQQQKGIHSPRYKRKKAAAAPKKKTATRKAPAAKRKSAKKKR
jgi:hypothetical protein